LNKQIEKLKRSDTQAYIRRVMWSSLDERVTKVFNNFKSENNGDSALGRLYISKLKDDENYRNSSLCSYQFLNALHIFCGTRFLGVNSFDKDKKKFFAATESNAQLWFSQGPTGNVLVFIAPYSSDLGEVTEKEIIIGNYSQPSDITDGNIKNHIKTFVKYAVATSVNSSGNIYSYLFRRYLIARDFRYKTELRSNVLRALERLLAPFLAILAIWVSLYTTGKI